MIVLAICVVVLLLMLMLMVLTARQHGIGQEQGQERFTTRFDKRSSCYSCEKAFAPEEAWRAQPSKCFSCERQMAATGGDPYAASRTITG